MNTNIKIVSYKVGKEPSSVAIADVNNDSNLDIVTGGESLSLLLGSPDGTFSSSTNFSDSVGEWPQAQAQGVAIADLNNDGYSDVVTANDGDDSVSVLFGNADGTFFPALNSPYSVGKRPNAVAIADVNDDDYLDIVTANYADNSVSVLLGKRYEKFVPAPNSPYSVGKGPNAVAIADLNKDGNLDIVTANSGNSSVSLLFGAINGPFSQSMDQSINHKPEKTKELDKCHSDDPINDHGWQWSNLLPYVIPSAIVAIPMAIVTISLFSLKGKLDTAIAETARSMAETARVGDDFKTLQTQYKLDMQEANHKHNILRLAIVATDAKCKATTDALKVYQSELATLRELRDTLQLALKTTPQFQGDMEKAIANMGPIIGGSQEAKEGCDDGVM